MYLAIGFQLIHEDKVSFSWRDRFTAKVLPKFCKPDGFSKYFQLFTMWLLTSIAFHLLHMGSKKKGRYQKKIEGPNKKNIFSSNFLSVFLYHLSSRDRSDLFLYCRPYFGVTWAFNVMAGCWVEQWAIGKLVRVLFHQVLSISLKYVTYSQKISKILFLACLYMV